MSAVKDPPPKELEGKIIGIRGELGEIVGELDRRRHEAFDIRFQLAKHKTPVILVGVGLAAILGLSIAVLVHRSRERDRPIERARRARRAFERLMDDPDNMAREPSVGEKILAAAGTAAASLLVKRAIDQAMPARPSKAATAK